MTTCTVTQHEPSQRQDVYTRITEKIVAALKAACGPGSGRGTPNTPPGASRGRCVTTASVTPASTRTDVITRIAHAKEFFAVVGAQGSYGGSRAFYRPSTDSIVMPAIEAFKDAESFYATLFHETCHWSSHPSRLARDFGSKR